MEVVNTDICRMYQAYLLLGSNLGDREQFLNQAIERLGDLGRIQARSGRYETAAWGRSDQPGFLNQALQLSTELEPEALLESVLSIERKLGRERKERYGPRTLDIDILLFEDRIVQSETLTIPHPELPNRRFALTPLMEIAPQLLHPQLNQSIQELFGICPDPLPVLLHP